MDARTAANLDDATMLDVREPKEWDAGHIPGALHIPLGELGARADELPRDAKIVCVCRSGARSQKATDALRAAGHNAENLEGGMKAWHGAGLPLEPSDGRIA